MTDILVKTNLRSAATFVTYNFLLLFHAIRQPEGQEVCSTIRATEAIILASQPTAGASDSRLHADSKMR